ncbi:MAG TPA: serine/threonine-protein kinase [Solirubrobacterales bacterium]|nr:serine/threonine-protein kinase [Solirubrobacterales bacterium]
MLEVGRRYGRFRVDALVNRGGMGTVWKVYDFDHSRVCAIKVLLREMVSDRSFRARLNREAEVLMSLRHPNVLPVYGTDEVDGLPCIVMYYVPDGDLRDHLDRTLDAATVLSLFRQACAGVHRVHKDGIYHRDLKPMNLLIERKPAGLHLYVADFGVAIGSGRHETRYTAHGFAVGTEKFIPPEARDGALASARGDVYSLGRCLEAMVGIHNCEGPIKSVIDRALEDDPEKRQADAIELYEEAAEALGPLGDRPLPPSPPRDPEETRADTAATAVLPPTEAPRTAVVDRAMEAVGLSGLAVGSCLARPRSQPRQLTAVISTGDTVLVQASRARLADWLASELDADRVEVVVLPDSDEPERLVRTYLGARFADHALPRDFDALRARRCGSQLEIDLAPRLDRLCNEEALAPLALFMGARKVRLNPIKSDPGR